MENGSRRLPRKTEGVLFDLDDTLYDRQATFRTWSEAFLRERVGIVDDAECAELLWWMESLDANGYGSKHAIMVEMSRRFPRARGSVEGFYDEFVDRVAFDPEARELLDRLDAAGMPYGVVTNGSSRQLRKVEALRLGDRTKTILVSEIFGAKKPERSIFLAAAKSIGVAPDAILFVGDHPVNDVDGAHSAGMMTAWLRRGRLWPPELAEADLTIESLSELALVLGV
jgi:putative hydrolase of the HAD superfamily